MYPKTKAANIEIITPILAIVGPTKQDTENISRPTKATIKDIINIQAKTFSFLIFFIVVSFCMKEKFSLDGLVT